MHLWICLIVASAILGVQSDGEAEETACQAHRRREQASSAPVKWDIECDENGDYRPKSCLDETHTPKWCTCYSKDGDQVRSPMKDPMSCNCFVEAYEARKAGKSRCEIPTCRAKGKYVRKQCCPDTGVCRCVDEETGVETGDGSNC